MPESWLSTDFCSQKSISGKRSHRSDGLNNMCPPRLAGGKRTKALRASPPASRPRPKGAPRWRACSPLNTRGCAPGAASTAARRHPCICPPNHGRIAHKEPGSVPKVAWGFSNRVGGGAHRWATRHRPPGRPSTGRMRPVDGGLSTGGPRWGRGPAPRAPFGRLSASYEDSRRVV